MGNSSSQFNKGILSFLATSDINLNNIELIIKNPDSVGIELRTGEITSINNLRIEVQAENSTGIFIDDGVINSLQNSSIIRNGTSPSTNTAAIAFQDDGTGYVNTSNITNNTICSANTSADSWAYLLGVYGNVSQVIDSEHTTATDPYNGSNSNIETFPWGDANTTTNSTNNLQALWGGSCPSL